VRLTALETFLIGDRASATRAARCRVIVGASPLRFQLSRLHDAVTQATAGDVVAYAVPLDGPAAVRLMMLATMWLRFRCVEWIMGRSGGVAISRCGIEPSLESPAVVFQMGSAASQYADRFLRARGSGAAVRRLAARCFGYDPAIGALLVVARKS